MTRSVWIVLAVMGISASSVSILAQGAATSTATSGDNLVTGRVVDGQTGAPIAAAVVALAPAGAQAARNAKRVLTDRQGRFFFPDVAAGDVTLTGSKPGWMDGAPGRDVTDLPVDIRPDEAASIQITLTDQISELSGQLIAPGGEPSTDYFVVVLPADRAYWGTPSRRIVNGRPDNRGRFVFRGLPAGEYRIAATTDLVSRDLQETRELDALAAQSLPLTIALGEKKVIDIRVDSR